MKKTAIITGATGLVGREVVRQLLDDEYYGTVIALVRRPLETEHEKLIQRVIDFEHLPEAVNDLHADHGYICLGTTIRTAGSKERQFRIDHDYVVMSAGAFIKAGVTKMAVVSSIGSDKESGNFYLRTKGLMENDLLPLPLTCLLIVRPSFLVGNRDEFRFGERIAKIVLFALRPIMAGRMRKYRGIKAVKVAEGMISRLKSPQEGTIVVESDKI